MLLFSQNGKFNIDWFVKNLNLENSSKAKFKETRRGKAWDRKLMYEIVVYQDFLGDVWAYVQVYKIEGSRTYFVQLNPKRTKNADYARLWFTTKTPLKTIEKLMENLDGKTDYFYGKKVDIKVRKPKYF